MILQRSLWHGLYRSWDIEMLETLIVDEMYVFDPTKKIRMQHLLLIFDIIPTMHYISKLTIGSKAIKYIV